MTISAVIDEIFSYDPWDICVIDLSVCLSDMLIKTNIIFLMFRDFFEFFGAKGGRVDLKTRLKPSQEKKHYSSLKPPYASVI